MAKQNFEFLTNMVLKKQHATDMLTQYFYQEKIFITYNPLQEA